MSLHSKIIDFLKEKTDLSFDELALDVFHYQAQNNKLYKQFLEELNIRPDTIKSIDNIPFLPISLFKLYDIQTSQWNSQCVFQSSGTSSTRYRSKHLVRDVQFYHSVSRHLFESCYGSKDLEIMALLPNYLENGDSSLVSMVHNLMSHFNNYGEAFYMYDFEALRKSLEFILSQSDKQIILIGVSFALIDFCVKHKIDNSRIKLIFTGGMKNQREEMSYEEVYSILREAYPSSTIDSEYGMTEMFSQSYCLNSPDGVYTPGRTIKIVAKEIQDPFSNAKYGKLAQLAFVDLANLDTISFVMTDDLVQLYEDQTFQLMGRLSQSDLRGCNLLYQS